jgi:hypothetical protein
MICIYEKNTIEKTIEKTTIKAVRNSLCDLEEEEEEV